VAVAERRDLPLHSGRAVSSGPRSRRIIVDVQQAIRGSYLLEATAGAGRVVVLCPCCHRNTRRTLAIGPRHNGIRTTGTESRMPARYQRYPVARFDNAHLAHVIGGSDSGDSGGNNGRWSGIDDWLVVTSISVRVAVVFGRHLESLGVSTRL